MKNALKIMSIIGLVLFANNVYAMECNEKNYKNKNGIGMTCEQVENLKNLGFTDYEIYHMDQEIFDANKNLKGEVLAETTKYYKTTTYYPNQAQLFSINESTPITYSEEITKEEYEMGEPTITTSGLKDDPVSTEYKLMTTTIINPGNGKYRYKNTVKWKKIPKIKHYDIIGIGIEDSKVYPVIDSNVIRAVFSYDSHNACYEEITDRGDWKKSSTGYAVRFKLPYEGGYVTWTGLNVFMYFDVAKQNPSSTISVLNAYGDYSHATSNFSNTSFSFGVSAFGISISASHESKYDEIPTSQATLTGISW